MATNIKVGMDLEGLTFGDLYDFVDLARSAGVPRDTEVAQIPWREDEPDLGVQKFEVALPASPRRKLPDFSDAELDKLVWALDDVIESEGDARGQIAELSEIRDRLRG